MRRRQSSLSCILALLIPATALCTAQPAGAFAMGSRMRRVTETQASAAAKSLPPGALNGLSQEETDAAIWLASEEMGQAHLFVGWETAAVEDKRRLLAQAMLMDARYPEDAQGRAGLEAYVAHARELLAESAASKNPFEGYSVELPEGERMVIGSESFLADERAGIGLAQDSVFVLVAGGLGERLGYNGIKVELPAETIFGASFLQTYIQSLLAMQAKGDPSRPVPLVIMTSEDTHEKTVALLEAHDYFGMPRSQLHFITQSNVPALDSNGGTFALSKKDAFELQTKPHGHGDVHTLLHQSGLLPKFEAEGRKYVVFFQDTNVLAFKAIPAALGVSERLGLAMNSLTVPRSAGEAAGAICKLVRGAEPPLVINVEYNQLDALLQSSGKGGDTADESGYSPYPGNVNTFIMALPAYAAALAATGGSMPEFVNPKYADAEKTKFKKPTRLECMMQDFPKLLGPEQRVGFSDFERWFSFSPVKNSIGEAVASHAKGVYAASPGAGEAAVYSANARLLRAAGVSVESGAELSFLELPLALQPAIALSPRFCLTADEIFRSVPKGAAVSVSARSTLILDGSVTLHGLQLDGALVIRAVPGAHVHVRDCKVANEGWAFVPVEPGAAGLPESVTIRGYTVEKRAAVEIDISTPGDYELTGAGELKRLTKDEL